MLWRIDILCVCTGNMCRSPAAQALLGDRLAGRGIDARVSSAGTRATLGPAADEIVELLAVRGVALDGFVSTQLTPELVRNADLVLGMAREHLREAVLLDADAFARTFTMKELVRRAREVEPRTADQPMRDWLALVHEGRSVSELLGDDPDDDITDPIGRRYSVFESVVDEIAELSLAAAALMSPQRAPTS